MPEQKQVYHSVEEINRIVVRCELCPRLTRYRKMVARAKRRQFMEWDYWGKPLPGFGDLAGRLLILGLAPAAHGGNRTGRMFTGDGSAQFLMEELYKFGFANQPSSISVGDGLSLHDAYMTAIVRCAPPKNKPSPKEIETCRRYWTEEVRLLPNVRVILALGRVAFETYVKFLKQHGIEAKGYKFRHGAFYTSPDRLPVLVASYHPSRQNTQTGKLTQSMLDSVLKEIQGIIEVKARTA